jgi:hypothetical protein
MDVGDFTEVLKLIYESERRYDTEYYIRYIGTV